MKAACSRPSSRITCAMPFASATSAPTSTGSQPSAHWALEVRRGSTTYRRAPLRTALSTWWKKIGCVSRALEPQSTTTSVSSTSRYEEVPPPAPNTVARPTTLGACQVRLQLSTLFERRTTRLNFCVAKFNSFVVLEQLKRPVMAPSSSAFRKPPAARSSASSQLAALSSPWSRTSGWVSRVNLGAMLRTYRTRQPAGRPPADHIVVSQCELARPRPDLLRAQVGTAGDERLEQRRVVKREPDDVRRPRPVEV